MKQILMSDAELRKVSIAEQSRSGQLSAAEAAELAGASDRTVRRWKATIKRDGAGGLAHGNRGQASPRRVPERERARIESLVRTKYPDFSSALATEKLSELHGIDRHRTTVRAIMVGAGLWVPRAGRAGGNGPVHRSWRERRPHRGELVQGDGSYHDWFEGRGGIAEACLFAAVDDATGEILWAQFVAHEGTLPVMGFMAQYAGIHGLPAAFYLDRFSTYKMNLPDARDNPDLKTQLQRAMDTLGVALIFARSPQAKGRVERLFRTLQDRLVKEMRLRGISTAADANRFLLRTFIPAYNRKYAVAPREAADFHRALSKKDLARLPETLCRQEERTVPNDFTFSFNAQWYQILATPRLAVRPKDTVRVRSYPDGTFSFSVRDRRLEVRAIPKRRPGPTNGGATNARTLVPD